MRHVPRMLRHRSGQFIVWVSLLLALSGLAACGGSATGAGANQGGTGTTPTGTPSGTPTTTSTSASAVALTCMRQEQAYPIDSTSVVFTCTVAHAPSSATGFTLRYRLTDKLGAQHLLQPDCAGALHNGQGACHQTYALTVLLAMGIAHGVVTGVLKPNQTPLGPIVPTA